MRRSVLWVVTQAALLAVGVSMTILLSLPLYIPILIVMLSVPAAIVLAWPEIRSFFDPSERIIKRGLQKEKSRKDKLRLSHVRALRAIPMMQNVVYDAKTGTMRVKIGWPRRRRVAHRLMHDATWLFNHRMLPECALRWLGRSLGYKSPESSE